MEQAQYQFAISPTIADRSDDCNIHELIEKISNSIKQAKVKEDIINIIPNSFADDFWRLRLKLQKNKLDNADKTSIENLIQELNNKINVSTTPLLKQYYRNVFFLIRAVEKIFSAAKNEKQQLFLEIDTELEPVKNGVLEFLSFLNAGQIYSLLESIDKNLAALFTVSIKVDFALMIYRGVNIPELSENLLLIISNFTAQIGQFYGALAIRTGLIDRKINSTELEKALPNHN